MKKTKTGKTAKKKTVKRANKQNAVRVLSPKQVKVQQALQVTWLLKGKLKSAQIHFLKIGALLAQVRDEKLYADLGHPDIEDYAEKRLGLGRASLYKYLQVYDWVSKAHPEWLQPKPKGFIPELYDISDLISIEDQLNAKRIAPAKKAQLEELRKKALEGNLKTGELAKVQKQGRGADVSLKSILSKVRSIRRKGKELAKMPAEAIKYLDAVIELIRNAMQTP